MCRKGTDAAEVCPGLRRRRRTLGCLNFVSGASASSDQLRGVTLLAVTDASRSAGLVFRRGLFTNRLCRSRARWDNSSATASRTSVRLVPAGNSNTSDASNGFLNRTGTSGVTGGAGASAGAGSADAGSDVGASGATVGSRAAVRHDRDRMWRPCRGQIGQPTQQSRNSSRHAETEGKSSSLSRSTGDRRRSRTNGRRFLFESLAYLAGRAGATCSKASLACRAAGAPVRRPRLTCRADRRQSCSKASLTCRASVASRSSALRPGSPAGVSCSKPSAPSSFASAAVRRGSGRSSKAASATAAASLSACMAASLSSNSMVASSS